METLGAQLELAVRYHRAGELDAAELHYRRILRLDPRHADALHLLGVAAHQRGRHREAAELIGRAVAACGSCAGYHCSLGAVLRDLEDLPAAVQSFQRAIELDSQFAGAHYNLAMALEHLGRWDEAAASYRDAVRLAPEFADAHNNLGRLCAARGDYASAASAFRSAVSARPEFAAAHYNLGNALAALGEPENAVDAYRAAVRLDSSVPEFHNNLGTAWKELGRYDEAARSFRAALALRPHYAEACNNLGSVLQFSGDLAAAERCFLDALAIRPAFAGALTNLGNIRNEQGRIAEAIDYYEQALQLEPQSAEARFNRALARLRSGDFSRGWAEYEWRWKRQVAPRDFVEPAWDGERREGQTILLYAEQGLGDEIQFASCLPDALARCDAAIVECDPRLVSLFARSFPRARVTARPIERDPRNRKVRPHCDAQIALGSLPGLWRRSTEEFPATAGYLVPDAERVARWQDRLAQLGDGLKVGITWRGGAEPSVQRRRSTELSQWSRILSVPRATFLALQYGPVADELSTLRQATGLVVHDWPEADRWNDIDDLAAQIAALDLVITVDNSTAHLAGALGTRVWTLLPFASDWRWLMQCDRTPWYPRMTLFRQDRPGEWDGPLERAAQTLETWILTATTPA